MNQSNEEDILSIDKSTKVLIYIISLGVVMLFLWAKFFSLDILSSAQGEVIPQGDIKSIQHLEGGIVKDILIKAGDEVKKGDKLVVLESTSSGADFGEIEVRLAFLKIEVERLNAAIGLKKELVISDDFIKNYKKLANNALSLHKTTILKYDSEISSYNEMVKQKEADLYEIRARVKNLQKSMKILKKQLAISQQLLKEELTNEYTHYDLMRREVELQTEIDSSINSIVNIKSIVKYAQEELIKHKHTFIGEQQELLKQVRQEIDQLTNREDKFRDSLERTIVKSPVDGTVKHVSIYTKGAVVKAGDTIVQIVPTNDKLIIEALLPPQDIGYVKVGQKVFLRMSSNDAMQFDKLDGIVAYVSPDTFTDDESGSSFYKVRIETENSFFQKDGVSCKLVPGMEVTAYIHIGSHTILDYILDPFKSSMDLSLSER